MVQKKVVTAKKQTVTKTRAPSSSGSMLSKINLADFRSKDVTGGFFIMMQDVDETCRDVIQWIIECNFAEDRPEVLNLVINSAGGNLTDAFAVIDTMRGSHIPIRTIGLGQIASAGLMIFLAGTKGLRTLTPNTSIMSHRFSGGAFGKEHELLAAAKEYDLTARRIITHYKNCTGLPEKELLEKLLPPQDIYLSSKEALALNICDRVVELA